MTTKSRLSTEEFLLEAEEEVGRYDWDGTFADYLSMLSQGEAASRLSHHLVYDAILSHGKDEAPESGRPRYKLFDDKVYGQDETIDSIVEYFASAARRLEIRKRILLLLGPPASGKSTIVALIKEALEEFTRTDEGAVYAIKNCPMQEDPLHLIPKSMRDRFESEYGIYVEGDLCPRCRYMVRTEHGGRISEAPVTRVVFSEQEAIGIGYYLATGSPDASLLVGSVDTSQLEGDRLEVAGKAFRLDGELNVANRGLMEFVEIFKADPHMLTTLLGLAQEQLIKMDRFGSVYADEAVIGHSNDGDFRTFLADPYSEALRDRIMRIYVPYNLRVRDEVRIYEKLLVSSGLRNRGDSGDSGDNEIGTVHVPPLTLPAISTFSVMSRLSPPSKQGVSLIDKLRAYDGDEVEHFSQRDVRNERLAYPEEGLTGISPRSVMNRLSARATVPGVTCVSPLNALDSLWQGRNENVSLSEEESVRYIEFVREAVNDYTARAIMDVKKAYGERFEETAGNELSNYLTEVASFMVLSPRDRPSRESERNMRDMEQPIRISERDKGGFRQEIFYFFEDLKRRQVTYDYTTEHRMRAAIERRLLPDERTLSTELEEPRSGGRLADWRRRTDSIKMRLIDTYGYCEVCAADVLKYAVFLLRNNDAFRVNRNEIEWRWPLNPAASEEDEAGSG